MVLNHCRTQCIKNDKNYQNIQNTFITILEFYNKAKKPQLAQGNLSKFLN